jgi:hypothetical protein
MNVQLRLLTAFLGISLLAAAAPAQTPTLERVRTTPDELTWTARPDGTSIAYIVGSSDTSGIYAYRLRVPRGFKPEPHFHPDDRVVAVMSGTFYVGFGDRFDETALKAMPPGSSWTEPGSTTHFAWAKDGDVVLHTVGFGPSGTTWIKQ